MTKSADRNLPTWDHQVEQRTDESFGTFGLAEEGKKRLADMTVQQLNMLLFWLESEPIYDAFCSEVRAELVRKESGGVENGPTDD